MNDLSPKARAPLLVIGVIALLAGISGGLVRLGFGLPASVPGIAWHGALLASAFFGTLIALERAVAIGRLWSYLAPAASGAGGIALLLGDAQTAFAMMLLGAAVFSIASIAIWRRETALHTAVLALGALALLAADLALLAGRPAEAAVPGWLAFFVLTIGGERLELSRLAPVPRAARWTYGVIATAQFGAALAAMLWLEPALRMLGLLFFAAAVWLARYDIATRTVRARGQTRYIALCLLAGYLWLAVGAILLVLVWGRDAMPDTWDAALHAILLGFVFSMVFGHAPIILPAVLRIALPYRPVLYLPLGALHASLLLRIVGDLAPLPWLRAAGGAGNALSIALFIALAMFLVFTARRDRTR